MFSIFRTKENLIEELTKCVIAECSVSNWDGDDSLPISQRTLNNAVVFITSLPNSVPLPDFAFDPDDAISFDWVRSKYCVFSISISNGDYFSYAWLRGIDKGYGTAKLQNKFPNNVLLRLLDTI